MTQTRPEGITRDFDDLAARLRQIAGERPFVFVLNPGNWGDSLIRAGAEAFLQHYGFRYHPVSLRQFRRGQVKMEELRRILDHDAPVMVFNGNGAMNALYERMPLIAKITQDFDTSIFLPATYASPPSDFGFAPGCHFFVRDQHQSRSILPDAPFCHDMAFFLTPQAGGAGRGTGFMFRYDREAPEGQQIPRGNVDLSAKGRTETPVQGFLDRIAKYETIHTNRLHVGIGAALLGRRTHLYANGYFKNRAIFESSLKPYFPKVTFGDHYDVPAAQVEPVLTGRIRRFLRLA